MNHKRAAEVYLNALEKIATGGEMRPEAAIASASIAQVYATLYLDEQQRIANVLALANAKRAEMLATSADDAVDWIENWGGIEGYLSKDDRVTLGLDDARP